MRERLAGLGHVWALPEIPLLSAPIVGDLMTALDGELLLGDESLLGREAEHMLVGGMNTEHVLERLRDGQLCIVAGDRPDVLLALVTGTRPTASPRWRASCSTAGSARRSRWRSWCRAWATACRSS